MGINILAREDRSLDQYRSDEIRKILLKLVAFFTCRAYQPHHHVTEFPRIFVRIRRGARRRLGCVVTPLGNCMWMALSESHILDGVCHSFDDDHENMTPLIVTSTG